MLIVLYVCRCVTWSQTVFAYGVQLLIVKLLGKSGRHLLEINFSKINFFHIVDVDSKEVNI